MAEDRIAALYTLSDVMTQAGDAIKEKHEEDYKKIIEYLKSSENSKERILAAQLVSRFFKHFSSHEEQAFDSIVDLCESADVDVRKHATMAMIAICKDCKHLVSKAADILIQLYQTNQATEVNLINQSLTTLLSLDIQKFLTSFFTNFEDGAEIVRERALKFLSTKIHAVSESALTKEVEEQLMTYTKKAMEDVTKDEFITFVAILSKLKIAKTATGQAMIVQVIKAQAELNKDFDVNDTDTLDKFLLCTKHSIPLFSQYNRASEYINYICLKILPHLVALAARGDDLKVLQALAEMSPHIHTDDMPGLIDFEKCQQTVSDKLIEFIPLPKNEEDEKKEDEQAKEEAATGAGGDQREPDTAADKDAEKPAKKDEANFQFTHIEYLIYTFHQFCRLKPEFFSETLQNDMKVRLQHLAQGCTKYSEILGRLSKEESDLKIIALRTTKNISTLVRDLFRKPPQFTTNVLLSCKPLTPKANEALRSDQQQQGGKSNYVPGKAQPQHHNGNHRGGHHHGYNRQVGHKFKYRQSYSNERNKRPRAR